MLTITIEVVLGVLFAVVLMNLFKRHNTPPASAPQPDLANLRPSDARTRDVIEIAGAGDDMSDLNFTADRTTTFQAGSRNWFEVSGPYRDRRVMMRVANEEELEVALHNDARKVGMADLGLSENDLSEMDERQNPADCFEFDSRMWLFRQSADATSRRDDQPQSQGFYYWEFREQDGNRFLTIRKPQGEPFAITLYTIVPVADVTIYRQG
jgi:hypothetical protein